MTIKCGIAGTPNTTGAVVEECKLVDETEVDELRRQVSAKEKQLEDHATMLTNLDETIRDWEVIEADRQRKLIAEKESLDKEMESLTAAVMDSEDKIFNRLENALEIRQKNDEEFKAWYSVHEAYYKSLDTPFKKGACIGAPVGIILEKQEAQRRLAEERELVLKVEALQIELGEIHEVDESVVNQCRQKIKVLQNVAKQMGLYEAKTHGAIVNTIHDLWKTLNEFTPEWIKEKDSQRKIERDRKQSFNGSIKMQEAFKHIMTPGPEKDTKEKDLEGDSVLNGMVGK